MNRQQRRRAAQATHKTGTSHHVSLMLELPTAVGTELLESAANEDTLPGNTGFEECVDALNAMFLELDTLVLESGGVHEGCGNQFPAVRIVRHLSPGVLTSVVGVRDAASLERLLVSRGSSWVVSDIGVENEPYYDGRLVPGRTVTLGYSVSRDLARSIVGHRLLTSLSKMFKPVLAGNETADA